MQKIVQYRYLPSRRSWIFLLLRWSKSQPMNNSYQVFGIISLHTYYSNKNGTTHTKACLDENDFLYFIFLKYHLEILFFTLCINHYVLTQTKVINWRTKKQNILQNITMIIMKNLPTPNPRTKLFGQPQNNTTKCFEGYRTLEVGTYYEIFFIRL